MPILFTEFGIVIFLSDVHPENEKAPMLDNELPNETLTREEHPENAEIPMAVTLSEIIMLVTVCVIVCVIVCIIADIIARVTGSGDIIHVILVLHCGVYDNPL